MDSEETKNTEEQETTGTEDQVDTTGTDQSADDQQDNQLDSDKAVDKLQKRLGKESAEKHDLEDQLTQARQLIEELKSGKKSVKELSDEDKKKQDTDEKDSKIQELELQIARTKAISETDAVFKEQGLVVSEDILNMVVGDASDSDSNFSNVKALMSLVNQIRDEDRKESLKGRTPRENGKSTPDYTKDDFANMTMSQKTDLYAQNPELFKKLTGGI